MLDILQRASDWLSGFHEDARFAALTLAVLIACHVWRSLSPKSWDKVAALLPKGAADGWQLLAHRLVQSWPALAMGVVAGLAQGQPLKCAAFGVLAAVLVIVRQFGAEAWSKIKPPRGPGGGLTALVCVMCLACSGTHKPDPATALAHAQSECAAYDALPSEAKTAYQDRACYIVKRVCIEELKPVIADPPSYGAKIVGSEWIEL
jgi:hypothetical protein